MSFYEIITTLIASTSILFSIGTFFWTKRINYKLEKEKDLWEKEKDSLRNATTYAQIEIMTQNSIDNARSRISNIGLEVAKNTKLNESNTSHLLTEAIENLLDVYDSACKRYFEDLKVDKKAFESEYIFEIHDLFSKLEFKTTLEKGGQNEYPHIYRFNSETKQTKK